MLTDGAFFGEVALLALLDGQLDAKRTASCVAVTYSDVYCISRDNFENMGRKFPELLAALKTQKVESVMWVLAYATSFLPPHVLRPHVDNLFAFCHSPLCYPATALAHFTTHRLSSTVATSRSGKATKGGNCYRYGSHLAGLGEE